MMAACQLTVSIKRAWWAIPYVRACMMFAWLTGMEPDVEKIAAIISRGMKCEINSE